MRALVREVLVCSAVTAMMCMPPAEAAEPQPGLWEISSTSERNGATVGQRTQSTCVTPEQARNLTEVSLDPALDPKNECKTDDVQRTGDALTWRVLCTGRVPVETKALYVFDRADHYSAVITTTLTLVRKNLTSVLRIDAKRTGECPR